MSVERLTQIIEEKEAKVKQIDGLTVKSDVFQKIIVYKPNFEHIVEITPQLASAQLLARSVRSR